MWRLALQVTARMAEDVTTWLASLEGLTMLEQSSISLQLAALLPSPRR